MQLLDVADELCPSSQFTAAALAGPAAEAGRPLIVIPMAAEITDPDRYCNPAARIATRQRHGLPVETVLFGFGSNARVYHLHHESLKKIQFRLEREAQALQQIRPEILLRRRDIVSYFGEAY